MEILTEAQVRKVYELTDSLLLNPDWVVVPLVGSAARFKRLVDAVGQPTLLIHGEFDRLVPLAAAEALARRRPDWSFVVLDGVGHTPQMEAPERFVDTVRAWMSNEGRAAADAAE